MFIVVLQWEKVYTTRKELIVTYKEQWALTKSLRPLNLQ